MFRLTFAALLLTSLACFADDKRASEASVREILEVTNARKLVDNMLPQMETMMRNGMRQAMGRTLSPDEQRIADNMFTKMIGILQGELTWAKLEPLYLEIYESSFTQEELDGILAFYKTPAGQALVKKLPVVMEKSMAAMQQRMGPMMQRIQQSMHETVMELQSGSGSSAKPSGK